MSLLLTQARIRRDADIRARVVSAMLNAGENILNEDPETKGHTQRRQWALSLRTEDAAEAAAGRLMPRVAANPALATAYASGGQSAVPDGDIEFIVASIIPAVIERDHPRPADPESDSEDR
jgi:hypothetical protein